LLTRAPAREIFKETGAITQSYNNVFDTLMLQFQDQTVYDAALKIHYTGESWPQIHQESSLTQAPFEIERHLVSM